MQNQQACKMDDIISAKEATNDTCWFDAGNELLPLSCVNMIQGIGYLSSNKLLTNIHCLQMNIKVINMTYQESNHHGWFGPILWSLSSVLF
jgi:hypothetical protein